MQKSCSHGRIETFAHAHNYTHANTRNIYPNLEILLQGHSRSFLLVSAVIQNTVLS